MGMVCPRRLSFLEEQPPRTCPRRLFFREHTVPIPNPWVFSPTLLSDEEELELPELDVYFMSYKISDQEESIDEDNSIIQDINDATSELF